MNANKNSEYFNALHKEKGKNLQFKKNYTHHELLDKIDRYKAFIKSKEDYDALEKTKQSYLNREGSKHITRAKRDKVFLLSQRTGISPDKTLSDIRKSDQLVDERHRQKVASDVKSLYRKNFSVLKMFKSPSITNEKTKPIEKTDGRASIKIPHKIKGEEQKKVKQKHFKVMERFGYASGSINQSKTRNEKEVQQEIIVSDRFNLSTKLKDSSSRVRNYNVYKTMRKTNKVKGIEKGMGRDR